jgi:parvulin-like peptidyl-prolyl isomerase
VKKDIAIAVIAALVIAAITFALDAAIPDKPMTPSQPVTGAKAGGSAAGADKSPVVLRVNGEPVTEQEFNRYLDQAPAEQRAMYETPQGRRMLAEELVRVKALEQEGRRMGLDKDPQVQSEIRTAVSQITAGRALQKLVGDPTEQQLRAEYEKARQQYETIQLSHILVAFQGGAVPPRNGQAVPAQAAMQKASAIAQRLRGGADFAQLARSESDDQASAQQGGTLGEVPLSQLPPDIAGPVSQLKPGQISDPVRTQYGIHIFRIGERKARAFEELKPALEQQFKRGRLEGELTKLTSAAKVDYEEKFFGPPPPAPKPSVMQPQPQPR